MINDKNYLKKIKNNRIVLSQVFIFPKFFMEKIVHRYEEKFSLIYRDANIGYWTIFVMMILALLALAVFVGMHYFHIQPTIFGANTFTISNDLAFGVFQFRVTHLAITTIILTSYVVIYGGLLLYVLKTLKKLALFGKEGDIFRPESKKIIQNLSGLFIFLAILGTRLVVVSIVIFIIILYESFFVGYHYKKENEKLSEENNLTI